MNNNLLLIIGIAFVIALIICAIVLVYAKKHTKTNVFDEGKYRKKTNIFPYLYRAFIITPLLKGYTKKVEKKTKSIFPADRLTIETLVGKEMSKCVGIAIAIIIAVVVICKGSIPYMIVGITGVYMIFTSLVNNSHEALERKLLDQLDEFISNLHATYHDSKDVAEAISSNMLDLPYEISLHVKKIYSIVTSSDIQTELEKYSEIAPNKFLLLLATICSSIYTYGDKELDDGKSLFLNNLTHLKNELNDERMRLNKKANIFRGKTFCCLIPLFILKPAESLLAGSIPELLDFYQGKGGLVSMAVVCAACLVCYEVLQTLKDSGDDKEEHTRLKKITKIKNVKEFITKVINKNYTKSLDTMTMLKITGEKDTIDVFYIRRFLFGFIFFVTTMAIVIIGNIRGKSNIRNEYATAYNNELLPSEDYRDQLKSISADIGKDIKFTSGIEESVDAYFNGKDLSEDMKPLIIAEMEKRAEEYSKTHFKWWALLISLVACYFGYMLPMFLLKYKAKILRMNREEEVGRFRTLILILMHEQGMDAEQMLKWMKKFSTIYKSSINECLMNLSYSEEEALDKLRREEGDFAPFKRLVNSLITSSKTGIVGAFDDLESEREYYHEKRKEDTNQTLKAAANTSSMVIMIPIYVTIALYIIIPFFLYVINMATDLIKVL